MKKLAIVTIKEKTGRIYAEQIEKLLKDKLPVSYYSFEKNNVQDIKEEVVLISTYLNYNEVIKNTLAHAEIVLAQMVFRKKNLELLEQIPESEDVYLYNLSAQMAIDTISLLQKTEFHSINYIPSFPNNEMLEEVSFIVTPGEAEYLKKIDKKVIDIGIRILEWNTILDILARMGLSHRVDNESLQNYYNSISPVSKGIERLMQDTSELETQFKILLGAVDDYIVVTNSVGFIFFHCNEFKDFINKENDHIIGNHIRKYIKNFNFENIYKKKLFKTEDIINIQNNNIILEIRSIFLQGKNYFIHKFKAFSKTERIQAEFRKKIYDKGHISRYTFEDIKGESSILKNTIKIAKRMAKSSSSVLITGDTGTGKELFAQAIHNASDRSVGAFVAVNCGVFNQSLFESELFGYEEGSFTGARIGGKQGLFEMAHCGTLFLDEIGEMNLGLQAKLLRVIQEGRIRKIGSEKVIDVNVRIIAATNRDLKKEIRNNTFRKDLYYRLNVLPLSLTSLNERKEDIVIIFKELKKEIGAEYKVSEDTWPILLSYKWDGNVRELRNVVEYLANIDEEIILPKHLPKDIILNQNKVKSKIITKKKSIEDEILSVLYQGYINHKKYGRRTLASKLEEKNIYLTENEIRPVLKKMLSNKLISSSRGRGGTKITKLGMEYIRKNNLV